MLSTIAILPLLGRLVVTPTSPPVANVIEDQVLFIKTEALVDSCAPDAGVDASTDDGGVDDAGVSDAGVGDAGVPDGGVCGLEQIQTITMVVQPELGVLHKDADFALLYVTPTRPQVTEQSARLFHDLAIATAAMVETKTVYVETESQGTQCSNGCGGGQPAQQPSGCGSPYESSAWDPPSITDAGPDDGGLGIETVGPYEIVRVQPSDRQQLVSWLDQLGYAYKSVDLDAVEPYLALGYHVVAVRMRPADPNQIWRRTTPLAFTYLGDEIRIPAALGRAMTTPLDTDSLTVYVAAEKRYEFPGAVVNFSMPTTGMGTSTYLTKNELVVDHGLPVAQDPVATGSCCFDYRATTIVETVTYVPKQVYCEDDNVGLCSDCNTGSRRRQIDFGTIAVGLLFALRRRRTTTA